MMLMMVMVMRMIGNRKNPTLVSMSDTNLHLTSVITTSRCFTAASLITVCRFAKAIPRSSWATWTNSTGPYSPVTKPFRTRTSHQIDCHKEENCHAEKNLSIDLKCMHCHRFGLVWFRFFQVAIMQENRSNG